MGWPLSRRQSAPDREQKWFGLWKYSQAGWHGSRCRKTFGRYVAEDELAQQATRIRRTSAFLHGWVDDIKRAVVGPLCPFGIVDVNARCPQHHRDSGGRSGTCLERVSSE